MKQKSAPTNTITGVHTNQMGALQAIVACDTNVAFTKRNLFFVLIRSLSEFCPCLILTNFGFNGQKRQNTKAVLFGLKISKDVVQCSC